MAAQLSFTNVRSLRWLCRWMARAMSSFPVPVSPVMSTAESVGAVAGQAAKYGDASWPISSPSTTTTRCAPGAQFSAASEYDS